MKERIISLDAFRGITIIAMIIVNTPGSWSYVFQPLRHAKWNGLTPTDLVFPFFLFIVGVSVVLSLNKIRGNANSTKSLKPVILKITKRSIILFSIGIALNLIGSNFEYLRIPGVLQRIALVFFACALIYLLTSFKVQIIITALILLGYYLIMMFIPISGAEKTEILPVLNVATWLDEKLIPFHMYQGTWDPEGILSSFPSIATGMLGVFTGYHIISSGSTIRKTINILLAGIVLLVVGEVWSWIFPLNKNMWTSSYVLYTGGIAAITLAVLMWLIDEKGYRKLAIPSIQFGSNAITAYILSNIIILPFSMGVFNGNTIQEAYMSGFINLGVQPELASLVWAIFITFLCFIPVNFMYRKKIFLKV